MGRMGTRLVSPEHFVRLVLSRQLEDNEVDEGAEFCGGKLPGGIEGEEGELFVGPVGEDVDQLAAVELSLD